MMKYKKINCFSLFFFLLIPFFISCNFTNNGRLSFDYSIPAYGNSWVVNSIEKNNKIVNHAGIRNWEEDKIRLRTFFWVEKPGDINIGIIGKSTQGKSVIKVTCGKKSKIVDINNSKTDTIIVGTFNINSPGYHWVEYEGVSKEGNVFAEVDAVLIGGEATTGEVYYVKDDFYWGRRGPSVHLNYIVPQDAGNIEWFYNEITVPEGGDALGSYFMANGFAQGYFGMQVNSEIERRILFSVWSPFKTDNPEEIPDKEKILLLEKGEGVHAGEFGNEGSGGQSFFRYNWKAGNTYKFLLKAKPTGKGSTDFGAWFFAPEKDQWKLIAKFRRPKTDSWLRGMHSFLENFRTDAGYKTRKALYSNQWVCNTKGEWKELTKMRFTADPTGRKKSRLDYAGGVEDDSFFLKNCGFFSETTIVDSYFDRTPKGRKPEVKFNKLP